MTMEPDRRVTDVPVREERRRGRPSLASGDTPAADVHLTLRPEDYDRLDAVAKRERKSIQQVIRDAVALLVRAHPPNLET